MKMPTLRRDIDNPALGNRLKWILIVLAGIVVAVLIAPPAAEAAVNYFNETKRVSGKGTATCPKGWRVTGGGAAPLPASSSGSGASLEFQLTGSYPASTTQWKATATEIRGYFDGGRFYYWTFSYTPTVYAICTR